MANVNDVMMRNIVSVCPSDPITEVAKKMRDHNLSEMPVCDNGRLRGMITAHAIVSRIVASARNPKREIVGTVMSQSGPRISIGCDLAEAARIMAVHRMECLPVIENGGKLAGLVWMDDLVNASPTLASWVHTRLSWEGTQEMARQKVRV